MKELLAKLSTYNIFNYLFPGVLFAAMSDRLCPYSFLLDDNVVGVFVYYFYGIVISRIGSLIIEPFLKWVRIIRFAPYPEFITASQKDSKLELLSEVNNMYRTITSVFFCLLLLHLVEVIEDASSFVSDNSSVIIICLMVILLVFSYRKQTDYVRTRITHSIKTTDSGKHSSKEEKDGIDHT